MAPRHSLWFETVAACPPTSRGGPFMGGDYPGFLVRELQGAVRGVALFGLGCAGDVRPHFTDDAGRKRPAELVEVEQAGGAVATATPPGRLMVMAYCNGAVGCVPFAAIYPHGGYEVIGSHPFYGLPATYAPELEATLPGGTIELVRALGSIEIGSVIDRK